MTTNTLYALLNRDAKNWWYHKKLRDGGQGEEARRLERESIKSNVATLRNALCATIGRGGWTIFERAQGNSTARLEHYGGIEQPMMQACLRLGVPIIDSTTVSEDRIVQYAIRSPLIAQGEPDEPRPHDQAYGPLSMAPLSYCIDFARAYGATVYNA